MTSGTFDITDADGLPVELMDFSIEGPESAGSGKPETEAGSESD